MLLEWAIRKVKDRQAIHRGSWAAKPRKTAPTSGEGKRKIDGGSPSNKEKPEGDPAVITNDKILALHCQAQALGRSRLLIIKQPAPSIFYENREGDSKLQAVYSVEAVIIGPTDGVLCSEPTLRILPETETQVLRFGYADRLTICQCSKHGTGFISDIKNKAKVCSVKCQFRQVDVGLATFQERLALVDQCVCPLKLSHAPWRMNWTVGEAVRRVNWSEIETLSLAPNCSVPKVSFHVEITGRQDMKNGVALKHYYGLVSIGHLHELTLPVVVGSHELSLADDGAEDALAQYILFFRSNLPPQPIRRPQQGKTIKAAQAEMKELTPEQLLCRRRLQFDNYLACPVEQLAEFTAARMEKFAQLQIDFDQRSQEHWAKELEKAEKNHPGTDVKLGFCSWGAYMKSPWSSFFLRLLEEIRTNSFTKKMLDERWMFQFMPWHEMEPMIKSYIVRKPDYIGKNILAIKMSDDTASLKATLAFFNSEKGNTAKLYRCDISELAEMHKVLGKLRNSLNEDELFQFDILLHPDPDKKDSMTVSSFDDFFSIQKRKPMDIMRPERTQPKPPYFGQCHVNLYDIDKNMMMEAQKLLMGELATAARDKDWAQAPMDTQRVLYGLIDSLRLQLAGLPDKTVLPEVTMEGNTATGITQTSPSHSQPSLTDSDQEWEPRAIPHDYQQLVVVDGPQTFHCADQMMSQGCTEMGTPQTSPAQLSFPSPGALQPGSPEEFGPNPGFQDPFAYRTLQSSFAPDMQSTGLTIVQSSSLMQSLPSAMNPEQGSDSSLSGSSLPVLDNSSVQIFFNNLSPAEGRLSSSSESDSVESPPGIPSPQHQDPLFWELQPMPVENWRLSFLDDHYQ